jgi:hypothetical protein
VLDRTREGTSGPEKTDLATETLENGQIQFSFGPTRIDIHGEPRGQVTSFTNRKFVWVAKTPDIANGHRLSPLEQ